MRAKLTLVTIEKYRGNMFERLLRNDYEN